MIEEAASTTFKTALTSCCWKDTVSPDVFRRIIAGAFPSCSMSAARRMCRFFFGAFEAAAARGSSPATVLPSFSRITTTSPLAGFSSIEHTSKQSSASGPAGKRNCADSNKRDFSGATMPRFRSAITFFSSFNVITSPNDPREKFPSAINIPRPAITSRIPNWIYALGQNWPELSPLTFLLAASALQT